MVLSDSRFNGTKPNTVAISKGLKLVTITPITMIDVFSFISHTLRYMKTYT